MEMGQGTPGSDSRDGVSELPTARKESPGGCCTRKGPGVCDGDTLDLGWSGRRLETRGQMCWVHPGDGLGEEDEDPPLHPPQEKTGPLSCSGSHAPRAPPTVLHWPPSAQDGPGLPQGL